MHICGPYSKVLNSNGGKYTYCWCAWKQVILGAVWNELLRQSCTSVARDDERTSTGAPCFPIMKLCMQKVWLHVSDLLFRLLFFFVFFFPPLALLCSHKSIICVIFFCSALSCQSWMQMTLQKAPVTVLLLSGQNAMSLETRYQRRVKQGTPARLITAQVSAVSQN